MTDDITWEEGELYPLPSPEQPVKGIPVKHMIEVMPFVHIYWCPVGMHFGVTVGMGRYCPAGCHYV